jgi:hypothetical protein
MAKKVLRHDRYEGPRRHRLSTLRVALRRWHHVYRRVLSVDDSFRLGRWDNSLPTAWP